MVEYAYSFLRLIFNTDFITAQSSLITAQMGSVTPPILGPDKWKEEGSLLRTNKLIKT